MNDLALGIALSVLLLSGCASQPHDGATSSTSSSAISMGGDAGGGAPGSSDADAATCAADDEDAAPSPIETCSGGSCAADDDGAPDAGLSGGGSGDLGWDTPDDLAPASTDSTSDKTAPAKRPLILVHGSGPPDRARAAVRQLAANLRARGFCQPIHYVDYDFTRCADTIAGQVAPQIQAIIDKYPEGTTFDIAGHSFGHFIAVYTIMTKGLDDHFGKLIGLAGVGRGAYHCPVRAPLVSRMLQRQSCGVRQVRDRTFIEAFENKYKKQIAALSTCSFTSPRDKIVSCTAASYYEGGVNKAVLQCARNGFDPTHVHYMMAEDCRVAKALLKHCLAK